MFNEIACDEINGPSFLKEICDDMYDRTFFGDKICGNKHFWREMRKHNHLEMLTPIKAIKG
jgi:hypothetical protein